MKIIVTVEEGPEGSRSEIELSDDVAQRLLDVHPIIEILEQRRFTLAQVTAELVKRQLDGKQI